jgi:hypothetical protein
MTTKEKVWQTLQLPAGLDPIGDNGDLMPVQEFINNCFSGGFIDYDGMGSWATETHYLRDGNQWIYPSKIISGKQHPPAWATHVLWYNR